MVSEKIFNEIKPYDKITYKRLKVTSVHNIFVIKQDISIKFGTMFF